MRKREEKVELKIDLGRQVFVIPNTENPEKPHVFPSLEDAINALDDLGACKEDITVIDSRPRIWHVREHLRSIPEMRVFNGTPISVSEEIDPSARWPEGKISVGCLKTDYLYRVTVTVDGVEILYATANMLADQPDVWIAGFLIDIEFNWQ